MNPPLELWRILLPVGLGLVAVFYLLPRVRRMPAWAGGLIGALALLTAGWQLARFEIVTVELVLFYIFAGLALIAGVMMITQRNPVRAALSFAVVVLSTCGLFLLQAAPFLMAATIIVYAGAIIVTFLFVIMLAQQSGIDDADARSREPLLSSIAGFVLLGTLIFVLRVNYDTRQFDKIQTRLQTAIAAETPKEINAALEKGFDADTDFFKALSRVEVSPPGAAQPVLLHARVDIANYRFDWMEADGNAEAMREVLKKLDGEVTALREETGSLVPAASLPLSNFSGGAPNRPIARDARGHAAMPADNVAALGRSLFSDYMIAVELAATLLLVAVVGAIVITQKEKRPEARP